MSNKTFDLVLAGVILAKIAEFEPINSKYSWLVIILTYLICSFIDILFSALRDKLRNI